MEAVKDAGMLLSGCETHLSAQKNFTELMVAL